MSNDRPSDDELWLIEMAIALLSGGRWIACFSLALTGVSGLALVATDLYETLPRLAMSAVLALGAVTAYLVLRIVMDFVFFQALRSQLSTIDAALASFDNALRSLRWLPPKKAGRGLAARVAGVQQLVRAQGLVLLLQIILIASLPWMQ